MVNEVNEIKKLHYPATARNREPIAAVLAEVLPAAGRVVELASGSGEHAAYFAGRFPALEWQPSDVDPRCLASIEAHRRDAGLDNLLPAIELDAAGDWAARVAGPIAAVYCANMIHIAPWRCCAGLLAGAAAALGPGGLLFLYGPYLFGDRDNAPSNLRFDRDLRARDPEWGVRRLDDVVAAASGFALERVVDMPANNCSVILRRQSSYGAGR